MVTVDFEVEDDDHLAEIDQSLARRKMLSVTRHYGGEYSILEISPAIDGTEDDTPLEGEEMLVSQLGRAREVAQAAYARLGVDFSQAEALFVQLEAATKPLLGVGYSEEWQNVISQHLEPLKNTIAEQISAPDLPELQGCMAELEQSMVTLGVKRTRTTLMDKLLDRLPVFTYIGAEPQQMLSGTALRHSYQRVDGCEGGR